MRHGKTTLTQPSRAIISLFTLSLAFGCALPEMHMTKRENGVGGAIGDKTSANAGSGATSQSLNASPSSAGATIGTSQVGGGGTAAGAGATGSAPLINETQPTGGTAAGGTQAATDTTTPGGSGSSTTGIATTGGTAAHSSTASGGSPLAGGTTANSGTAASGGTVNVGSTGTAGVATGGTIATGGTSATSATGGIATGGVATGGTTATGGAATGGIPATGLPYVPTNAQSCTGLGNICQGESCCTSIKLPGGTYPMGRSAVSNGADYYAGGYSDELPEHNATVASFALDKYEVTVGRFRKFVANYDVWHKANGNPTAGLGAHPIAPNTGWGQSWTSAVSDLPADATALTTALKCNANYQTWKDTVDTNEAYPINCASWFAAFAFCIWDGGRLPTEAEWEYAAAGGSQNRLFPWGNQTPDYNRANYDDSTPAGSAFTAVGSKQATGGAGYFNHADLSGSMWEWVLDWYWSYSGVTCNNCSNTSTNVGRVIRGGCWFNDAGPLRAASRGLASPAGRDVNRGFRCARTP